jgi:hypothetical protein
MDGSIIAGSIQRGGWAMAINMFEGARRIAKLVAVVWILVSGWLAIEDWQRAVENMPTSLQYLRFVSLVWILIGLGALWAFTWATGWIVRGFMGIPRGSDNRE